MDLQVPLEPSSQLLWVRKSLVFEPFTARWSGRNAMGQNDHVLSSMRIKSLEQRVSSLMCYTKEHEPEANRTIQGERAKPTSQQHHASKSDVCHPCAEVDDKENLAIAGASDDVKDMQR
jgi:hypothetical protein